MSEAPKLIVPGNVNVSPELLARFEAVRDRMLSRIRTLEKRRRSRELSALLRAANPKTIH